MKEITLSGIDELRRHVLDNYGSQRFLFRGEHRDWGDTYSSLDRLQSSKLIPQDHWKLFDERLRRIVWALDVVVNARPLQATPDAAATYPGPSSLLAGIDQLPPECLVYATLQHYGVPSPFIDLSEDLEVALFFASYPPDSNTAIAVMFVVDSEHEQIKKRLARMPDSQIHHSSRHARQGAHGLCLRLGDGVRDVKYTKGEDFRKLDGVLTKITFPWPAEDRKALHEKHFARLLSVRDDRLGQIVYDACQQGLDNVPYEAIRVHGVFESVRASLAKSSHLITPAARP